MGSVISASVFDKISLASTSCMSSCCVSNNQPTNKQTNKQTNKHSHHRPTQLYILYCYRYAACFGPSSHSVCHPAMFPITNKQTNSHITVQHNCIFHTAIGMLHVSAPSPHHQPSVYQLKLKPSPRTHTAVWRHSYRPYCSLYQSLSTASPSAVPASCVCCI